MLKICNWLYSKEIFTPSAETFNHSWEHLTLIFTKMFVLTQKKQTWKETDWPFWCVSTSLSCQCYDNKHVLLRIKLSCRVLKGGNRKSDVLTFGKPLETKKIHNMWNAFRVWLTCWWRFPIVHTGPCVWGWQIHLSLPKIAVILRVFIDVF